jgi:hypothetical protein
MKAPIVSADAGPDQGRRRVRGPARADPSKGERTRVNVRMFLNEWEADYPSSFEEVLLDFLRGVYIA